MEDCSFNCEESLGVCESENFTSDLELNNYIALYLIHCSSNGKLQILLMGINGNPFDHFWEIITLINFSTHGGTDAPIRVRELNCTEI